MENFIIIAIVVIIVGLAVLYIYKSKKNGKNCIGCPDSCCSSKQSDGFKCTGCCSGCHNTEK
ncbi:MAG: FeoB-associated Cys-rich membrane protein [Clostridia bacterium]|nr:FeoB-associated Cys-rich membrane protein [Clostridia bacterium]